MSAASSSAAASASAAKAASLLGTDVKTVLSADTIELDDIALDWHDNSQDEIYQLLTQLGISFNTRHVSHRTTGDGVLVRYLTMSVSDYVKNQARVLGIFNGQQPTCVRKELVVFEVY